MASLERETAARLVQIADAAPPSIKKGTSIVRRRPTKNGKAGRRSRMEQTNGADEKGWNLPLTLDREELMTMLQECLTDFATEVGLKVACLLFDRQIDVSCERANSEQNGSGRRRTSPRKKKAASAT